MRVLAQCSTDAKKKMLQNYEKNLHFNAFLGYSLKKSGFDMTQIGRFLGEDARINNAWAMAIGRVDQRINRRAQVDIADSSPIGLRKHAWMPGGEWGPK